MMLTLGILYAILIELALVPLLTVFGATPDVMPYAEEYTRITAVGMPLLIVTNGMSSLAPRRRQPQVLHDLHARGCHRQHDPGPGLYLSLRLGRRGRGPPRRSSDRPAPSSWAVAYLRRFRSIRLRRTDFGLPPAVCLRIAAWV